MLMVSDRTRRLMSLLFACGYLLLLAAVISYLVRMALYPAERWTGGAAWDTASAASAIALLRFFRPRQRPRDWTLERISVVAFISLLLAAAFAL